MKYARRQLNATILADGKVLVTGGMSGPGFNDAATAVLAAEMWDPLTGKWTEMASMKIPRLYHSTALLLPDGRVLSAGGGQPAPLNGVDNSNAEIYSPPYLFTGSRPTVKNAPATLQYGQGFFVETPDAGSIVKATWIRLGAVTHAFNMNQRINYLQFTKTATGLNVTAPADPNLTPPGHYMLFLINERGVPSIARIIQIQ
ncbi:Kelch motif-containing protein [Noviherbaspirillum humi]|uniref:Kelch motif-containing protein n=1 Tax=Noviherbaspirillum humi TaxID=1688639 RepID=A0A239EUX1_9BURK|nr:galactose oxidase-like domain-containing protein [Noviherbaspirillum humi]SNS48399.1 Kelch motif-containing protein [Noviherbaspirillum humi]